MRTNSGYTPTPKFPFILHRAIEHQSSTHTSTQFHKQTGFDSRPLECLECVERWKNGWAQRGSRVDAAHCRTECMICSPIRVVYYLQYANERDIDVPVVPPLPPKKACGYCVRAKTGRRHTTEDTLHRSATNNSYFPAIYFSTSASRSLTVAQSRILLHIAAVHDPF